MNYPLLMAVLWSNAMIFLVYCLRRSVWFVQLFGLRVLLLVYGGCFLRLLVNIEFSAAREVNLPQLNFLEDFFQMPVILGGPEVPMGEVLLAVWIVGSLFFTARIAFAYWVNRKKCNSFPAAGPQAVCCLREILGGKAGSVRAVESPSVRVPCIAGVWKAVLCLPKKNWDETELRLILEHECMHYRNHDALTAMLTDFFCAIFWWNPCVYLLKNHLSELLEYKTDLAVIRGKTRNEAARYCRVLLKYTGMRVGTELCLSAPPASIGYRIDLILNTARNRRSSRLCQIVLFFFGLATLALSYLFIFQSYYTAPLPADWELVSIV